MTLYIFFAFVFLICAIFYPGIKGFFYKARGKNQDAVDFQPNDCFYSVNLAKACALLFCLYAAFAAGQFSIGRGTELISIEDADLIKGEANEVELSGETGTSIINALGDSHPPAIGLIESPVALTYEVYYRDHDEVGVYYLSQDLRHVFYGSVVDVDSLTNISNLKSDIYKTKYALKGGFDDMYKFNINERSYLRPVGGMKVSDAAKRAGAIEDDGRNIVKIIKSEPVNDLPDDDNNYDFVNNVNELALSDDGERKSPVLTAKESQDLEEYKKKWEERIRKRMSRVESKDVGDSAHLSQPSSVREDAGSKKSVDVEQMQDGAAFIEYKGTRSAKIGFDESGSRLSPDLVRGQVKGVYERLEKLGSAWSVEYPAIGDERVGVFVFSDPTCGFCKKLHHSIGELNKMGVTVRVLMYPRALVNGDNDPLAKSVMSMLEGAWCSEDPMRALDLVYGGKRIDNYDCSILKDKKRSSFPAKDHYFLGKLFGLQGTPLSFTSNGDVISGFGGLSDYAKKIGI